MSAVPRPPAAVRAALGSLALLLLPGCGQAEDSPSRGLDPAAGERPGAAAHEEVPDAPGSSPPGVSVPAAPDAAARAPGPWARTDAGAAPADASAADSPVPGESIVIPVPLPGPSEPEPSEAPTSAPELPLDAGTPANPDAGAPPETPSQGGHSDADGFTIELVFEDETAVSSDVLDAFLAAQARWQSVVVGDLPEVYLSESGSCNGHPLPASVDDVVVFVRVLELDGPEGLLGAAGPCAIRSRAPRLPFAAAMEFDAADLDAFAEAGRLEEIVLHEMGHALGIGSLWEGFGLVDDASDGSGEADTAFNGPRAREAFDAVGGSAYLAGAKVPVENRGSEGEINGHWRESALGSELMTTRMGGAPAALSAVTIASLEDMGYQVDANAADDYSWPSADGDFSFRVAGAPAGLVVDLRHDRLALPLYELLPDGSLRRVLE